MCNKLVVSEEISDFIIHWSKTLVSVLYLDLCFLFPFNRPPKLKIENIDRSTNWTF